MSLFPVHNMGVTAIRKGEENDKAATGTEREDVK
jgi:hypothetical protein